MRKMLNLSPIEIEGCHRWAIYYRLRELGITCTCTAYAPLIVKIENAMSIVQLWSVATQVTTPRQTQINWLETCLAIS